MPSMPTVTTVATSASSSGEKLRPYAISTGSNAAGRNGEAGPWHQAAARIIGTSSGHRVSSSMGHLRSFGADGVHRIPNTNRHGDDHGQPDGHVQRHYPLA